MGKALKAVGTAIVVVGLAVATGGASVALGAGVGAFGSVGLGWSASSLAIGGFSVTASGLVQGGMLISSIGSALSAPKASSSSTARAWTAAAVQPIPFAFGEIAVAGKIIHRDEYGPNNMYQAIVSIVDGGGPITQFLSFEADEQAVTFDGGGKAISSEYANEMWINYRLGSQPDTAFSPPTGLKSGGDALKWSSAHKLSGLAGYMLTLAENSKHTAYPGGEPTVLQRLRGEKCWDPRQDSTWPTPTSPVGSGSCRLNDPSTWVYSTNGAIHALKWTLGLWWDGTGAGRPGVGLLVGGLGVSPDGIDIPAFVNAANVADANGWTCGAWPNSAEDKHQVLKWFFQAAGAVYAEDCGKVSCISRGEVVTSILTLTARDTAGPVELDAGKPRLERINTLTPTFWSPEHRWEMTPLDPVSVPEYVAEDGGVQRGEGVDYPYVTDPDQAAQLCAYDIVDSREGISGALPLKPYLRRLRPGHAATINEPGFLLHGQKIKVWSRSYDPATAKVTVKFTSETDAKHAFAQGQTGSAPPTPSLTAAPVVNPPEVGDWTATAGLIDTDSPVIIVAGSCENAAASAVVFEYRLDGASDWTLAGTESPTVTQRVIGGLSRDAAYEVAVSYRAGNRSSMRLILGPVSVGDTTPPGPVTSGTVTGALGAIDLRWTNPTDADFDRVRVWRHTADVVGSAVLVGEIRGTAWRDAPPAVETDYWYWVSTVDRSGNEGSKTALGSGQAGKIGDIVGWDEVDWGDVGDRPTELTDGRIAAALAADGALNSGAILKLPAAEALVGAQPFVVTGVDGETVYFPYELPAPPKLALAVNSRLKTPTRAGEFLDITPTAITGSYVTLRAKLVYPGTGPTYTPQVDDDATGSTLDPVAGAWIEWGKETDDVAWDRQYVASVDVICDGDPDPGNPSFRLPGYTMTLRFYGRRDALDPWTMLGERSVVSVATGDIGQPANNTPQTVQIPGYSPAGWTSWVRHAAAEYMVAIVAGGDAAYRKVDAMNSVTYSVLTSAGAGAEEIDALESGQTLSLIAIPDLS